MGLGRWDNIGGPARPLLIPILNDLQSEGMMGDWALWDPLALGLYLPLLHDYLACCMSGVGQHGLGSCSEVLISHLFMEVALSYRRPRNGGSS